MMDPITEIFIKEEVFQETFPNDYMEQPSVQPSPQKPAPEPNQFLEVLIKEAEYVEAGDDLATVIEIDSDVECISINSDSSGDLEEVLYSTSQPPGPVAPLQPSVLNVRTAEAWEAPLPQETSNYPFVSDNPIDPLSGEILNTEIDGLSRSSITPRPMDFFNLFVTDELIDTIINETNKHGKQLMTNASLPFSRMKNFRELTVLEFKRFLGLLYHMGNVKLCKISDYWMMGRYFHVRIFGETMGRNRFYQILRSLNFSAEGNSTEDRLSKIRPIMDYFNNRMKVVYHLENEFSSEEMALLRAKLIYQQCRRAKKERCEIKMYMVTDPDGLVLRFHILGKDDTLDKQKNESEIIKSLLEDQLTKANSVNLENGETNYTNIVNRKRKSKFEDDNQKKQKEDETLEEVSEENGCVFQWEDKEDTFGLSLEFHDETKSKEREVTNQTSKSYECMSKITLKDRMTSFYACERESLPSHIKIGLHILQLLLLNAYTLHRKRVNSRLSFLRFRMSVIQELIGECLPFPTDCISMTGSNESVPVHLPVHCPRSDKNRVLKRQCVQCKALRGKRIESIFMCPMCPGQPGLCLENCFRDYHNYI